MKSAVAAVTTVGRTAGRALGKVPRLAGKVPRLAKKLVRGKRKK